MARGPNTDTPEKLEAKKEAQNLIQNLEKYLDGCLEKEKQFNKYTFVYVKEDDQIEALERLRELFLVYGINPIPELREKYKSAGWLNMHLGNNNDNPIFSFVKRA